MKEINIEKDKLKVTIDKLKEFQVYLETIHLLNLKTYYGSVSKMNNMFYLGKSDMCHELLKYFNEIFSTELQEEL